MKSTTYTLLLLFFSFQVFGQTADLIKKQGDLYFNNEQYTNAIEYYKRALSLDDGLASAKYGLAECYRLTFDYESAESYYGEIAELGSEVFPLAGYHFGVMKKLNGKYEEAIIELDKSIRFLRQNGFSEDERYRKYYTQARIEKEGCQFALNELSKPKINRNFQILGEPVNSTANDYGAYTYGHDSSLVISSGRSGGTGKYVDNKFGEGFGDIFRFNEITEGVWEESKEKDKFGKNVNTKWGDGAGAFNTDRSKYYFTNCNADQGGCQIFLSTKVDGEWTEAQPLNRNVNELGTNTQHPALTPGGDTLFFASDRKDGRGGYDIWFSVSFSGDNWGVPTNMGPQVNTEFDEISPFFDSKERALFLASNGHRGFGGLDIFMAKGKNFFDPEIFNLGAPYNSNQDECFFMLGEKHGYLSSNRDGGIGKFDIYSFLIETDAEIITEIEVDEAIAGRNSMFSDDYEFDNPDKTKLNEIISKLLAAEVADVDVIFNSEDANFYNSLSQDDKEKIDRIVKARFRNLAQSDLRALRIEDEFYYQELGKEEKQAVDQMILSRLEQADLALSIQYQDQTMAFYNSLNKENKEKVDQFIAFKLKEAEKILLSPETYNSLDAKSQREVDNIALKYFTEKKNLETLSLNPSSLMFIKSLEGVTKKNVYTAVKEQIINLTQKDQFSIVENDRIFYQNLSSENLDKLEGIATAFITADLERFEDYITPTERQFYANLSSSQKKSADRVLAKLINNYIKSDLYYAEANLDRDQIAQLSERRESVNSLSELMAALDGTELKDIASLEAKNQRRIDRFLMSSAGQYLSYDIDGFFPEGSEKIAEQYAVIAEEKDETTETTSPNSRLQSETGVADATSTAASSTKASDSADDNADVSTPIEERSPVDLVADNTEKVRLTPNDGTEELDRKDAVFYDENAPETKVAIDQIVAAAYLNKMGAAPDIDNKGKELYKKLTMSEKDYVKLLTEKMKGTDVNPNLFIRAQNYYNNLAPKAKEDWNVMVLSRSLNIEGSKFVASQESQDIYKRLPAEEKEIVERIKNHRFANNRLIPDIQIVEAMDVADRKVIENLVSYNTSNFDYIYISGQLTDEKTGEPMANYPLAVRKKNGDIVYQTYTDNAGNFKFENIPSARYDIISNVTGEKENFQQGFFIRSLNVSGTNTDLYDKNVLTSIYFDSGAKGLRAEAEVTLDEISDAFKNSDKDMIIQLNGHTDNVGDETNNLALSKIRSEAAYQYLVAKGVPADKIIINFYGASRPATGNENAYGRQFNRRVEITLKDNNPIKYIPSDVYLIRPKGTLFSIAKNFNVSVEQIRLWNGLSEDAMIQAYRPLRIYNPGKIKPNLDMLVELNSSLNTGMKTYTVQVGDTIEQISKMFNIPEELLFELNGLKSRSLKPGQKLKIYIR